MEFPNKEGPFLVVGIISGFQGLYQLGDTIIAAGTSLKCCISTRKFGKGKLSLFYCLLLQRLHVSRGRNGIRLASQRQNTGLLSVWR